ncbi:T9SS type A sorting domain-containing protein [Sabulilitoribacter multivorans]|uniref:T9SS type A sorting domain-containing protein n=1 Tax=Flaviramulus multivorans TaxID=1304750 RepID=A0ABS9IJA5_9FLAO|nr:T9SS type A sorting domain-containing protein [Flaviramulus multivorans]MCF7560675.1 T9SS type A sorting domain-containing protein [Flaviramulus multivorans]
MYPQIHSKSYLTLVCLFLVVLCQAQEPTNPLKEKLNLQLHIVGSAGLNDVTNEIDMRGEVTNLDSNDIIERGFVYSTTENLPTINDTKIINESNERIFKSKLTDLLQNTFYNIRPYIINKNGVVYGSLNIIDTSSQPSIDVTLNTKLKTYPNPSTNYISLAGLMETKNYIIYNMKGKELTRGQISFNNKIDIRFLEKGLYLLKLEDVEIIKFIKN